MKLQVWAAAFAGATLLLGGCSGKFVSEEELSQKASLIEQRESEINELRSSLQRTQQQLRQQKTTVESCEAELKTAQSTASRRTRSGSAVRYGSSQFDSSLIPPNAKPGECYARVFVPPSYQMKPQRVVEREESERVEVIPGKYEWTTKRVLVREASEKLEVIPPKYDWKTERVLVKPAVKRIQTVPAKYRTVTEKVIEKPAHTVWKKGTGLITKIDEETGEIMCLVEVPATYKTVKKRTLVSPETTKEVVVQPAKYETVRKRVLVSPARTRTVKIPPEYKTVRVQKEVVPPKTRRYKVPAKYTTVTKRVKVKEGEMKWRLVLCETNMTPRIIRDMQNALRSRGYYRGSIDGQIGNLTMQAVERFQRENNLSRGGITIEVLERLGVSTTPR